MTGTALSIVSFAEPWLQHILLVFLRCGALSSLLPPIGEKEIPVRIRLAAAFLLTISIVPAVPSIPPLNKPDDLALCVVAELATGLFLGLLIRLFIIALQAAASMAAQATSLAQILGGATHEPMPAIGYVLVFGGLALAASAGLHTGAARLLIESYDLFPFGQTLRAAFIAELGVTRITHTFALAFTLAAPFIIFSLIYNIALGVINRAMPQLMVALVGAPVITWGTLVLLMLSITHLFAVWHDALWSFMSNPAETP